MAGLNLLLLTYGLLPKIILLLLQLFVATLLRNYTIVCRMQKHGGHVCAASALAFGRDLCCPSSKKSASHAIFAILDYFWCSEVTLVYFSSNLKSFFSSFYQKILQEEEKRKLYKRKNIF